MLKAKEILPNPESAYDRAVTAGRLQDDPAQRRVWQALEALKIVLNDKGKPAGGWKRWFTSDVPPAARSLYVWGGVGRGKSMLMDLFFDQITAVPKRRVHFHAFMQEIHARMHQMRHDPRYSKSGADPVVTLAQEIAATTRLLCFDELQATDVADATLLFRLFDQLFAADVVVVSTSNQPPATLYTGGVQRERFDKFIALIHEHMEVMSLESPRDYRTQQAQSAERCYAYPLGKNADAALAQWLAMLCKEPQPMRAAIHVQGRSLPFSLYDGHIGRFTFHDLCETPLGAADYLAIAEKLDTVILTDIPRLSALKRNEAKRFVTLIDALYERRVKLFATAEAAPDALYPEGDGAFEFKRTASRLHEMGSEKWLHTPPPVGGRLGGGRS